ncbi:MAG: caspase family protein [Crocinitomicaceae bacterium]
MKKGYFIFLLLLCFIPLKLWAQDVRLAVQTGHSAPITDLCFNSDASLFASASEDNNVAIWHVKSGKQYANLSGHSASVTNIAFHDSKNRLYSVSKDSSLIVWDVVLAKQIKTVKFDFPITSMSIDITGNRIAIAGNYLIIYDINTEKQTKFNLISSKLFTASRFSKSGKWLAVGGVNDRFTRIVNVNNKEVIGKVYGNTNDMVFDDEERVIYCANENGGISSFNFYTNEVDGFTNKTEGNSFNSIRLNDRYLIGTTDKGEVLLYSAISSSLKHILKAHLQKVNCVDIDKTGQFMITGGNGKRIILWDLKTLEMLRTFKSSIFRISQIAFSEDSKEILIGFANGAVRKNDLFSNHSVSNRVKLSQSQIQNGWEFFLTGLEKNQNNEAIFNLVLRRKAIASDGGFDAVNHAKLLWNLYENEIIVQESSKKSEMIKKYEKALRNGNVYPKSYFVDESLSKTTSNSFSAVAKGDKLLVQNLEAKAISFSVNTGHTDKISSVAINEKYGFVATASWDGMIKFWSLTDGKLLTTYGAFGGSDFVYISPDNYYFSSKGALDNIGFIYDGQIFSFDQFDLVYNRPDLVFEHLPYISPSIIKNYKRAYTKRLSKLGVDESELGISIDIPELEVINKTGAISSTGELLIDMIAKDKKQDLAALHVLINGVPVYGKGGKILTGKEAVLTDVIKLIPGKNNVQVYVTNQENISSFKENFQIVSKQKQAKSNLYVLALGCSKYQENEFNLNFAEKDASDIIKYFKKSKEFDDVFVKKLVNEQVVWASANDMKNFLKPATENDVVILFIAGHGVLDADLDYFIAAHDMNFNHPEKKGIPIQFFDNLIDGVKSRKKLMFIDACHSGEIDKTEFEVDSTTVSEQAEHVTFRAVGNAVKQVDEVSTFELSKMAFADMRESNGSTVISSAGGGEYAMEGAEWSNGVFTYSLLKGLKTGEADLNRDKIVMVSELHSYLIRSVNEITKGRQTPTSRVENLDNDFRIK